MNMNELATEFEDDLFGRDESFSLDVLKKCQKAIDRFFEDRKLGEQLLHSFMSKIFDSKRSASNSVVVEALELLNTLSQEYQDDGKVNKLISNLIDEFSDSLEAILSTCLDSNEIDDSHVLVLTILLRIYKRTLNVDLLLEFVNHSNVIALALLIRIVSNYTTNSGDDKFVMLCCKLLLNFTIPNTFFAVKLESKIEERAITDIYIKIEELSYEIIEAGLVQGICEIISNHLSILEKKANHVSHVIISSILEFIKNICELLPGDGEHFRAYLSVTKLINQSIQYMLLCCSSFKLDQPLTQIGRYTEVLDYDHAKLYYYDNSNCESSWYAPAEFLNYKDVHPNIVILLRGFHASVRLMLSVSDQSNCRSILAANNPTYTLLSNDSQNQMFLHQYKELAWLILLNVALDICHVIEAESKNENAVDVRWLLLSFIKSLDLDTRYRCAVKFNEQCVYLPPAARPFDIEQVMNDDTSTSSFYFLYSLLLAKTTNDQENDNWIECNDANTSEFYYVDVLSQESQWERPNCLGKVSWLQCFDDESECYYYSNILLDYSQWDLPTEELNIELASKQEQHSESEGKFEGKQQQQQQQVKPQDSKFRLLGELPSLKNLSVNEKIQARCTLPSPPKAKRKEYRQSRKPKTTKPKKKAPHLLKPKEIPSYLDSKLVPTEFICELTHSIMKEPVSVGGRYYDRRAIELYIAEYGTDPVTKHPLKFNQLKEETHLKQEISEFHIKQSMQLNNSFSMNDDDSVYEF